ncbi:hypothetical protein TURU_101906 [Turdus rufiventris]|nr:hypothetical protein TURU_101906 [Turdus rufiventris]
MDALGKVVLELHRQWGIDCKVKDFECAVTRLLKLGAIDHPVDVLRLECWDKCIKALSNDVMFSGSGKCLKSWGRVTQALQKALLEQETWKVAQSCLKVTPKAGVGTATQTAFGDCFADSNLPPKVKDCSWSRSRSFSSTPDLTTKQGQQLGGVNTCELESGLGGVDPEGIWERPPLYAPQNGPREEGEGRGEELLPTTDMHKQEPEGKGEESMDDKREESPRPNQGPRPRTLSFKEGNSPKGRREGEGEKKGRAQVKGTVGRKLLIIRLPPLSRMRTTVTHGIPIATTCGPLGTQSGGIQSGTHLPQIPIQTGKEYQRLLPNLLVYPHSTRSKKKKAYKNLCRLRTGKKSRWHALT